MSAPPLPPGFREQIDALGQRLSRIEAAAATLRALTADARPGIRQDALVGLLEQLHRDLTLSTRDAQNLHDRAVAEARRDDGGG